jgi:prevent-host-death family protein
MAGKRRREGDEAPRRSRVSASQFKTHCLSLMKRVQQTRQAVTVTRYGVPVAKLVPVDDEETRILGHLEGTVIECGDLVSSIVERWQADD